MNIIGLGVPWYDFQMGTIVDGLLDLGHKVYDLSDVGQNFMAPIGDRDPTEMDLFIMADSENSEMNAKQFFRGGNKIPKIIIHPYDKWLDHIKAYTGQKRTILYEQWSCDIAFVRDLENPPQNSTFPIYPLEYGIEKRFIEACNEYIKPLDERIYDVMFVGTWETANRKRFSSPLENNFKCMLGNHHRFVTPDDYWSKKWINGRFFHCLEYFETMCNSRFVICPLGSGPSCGRTYEAYAAGAIPLIERFPGEVKQIIPFVNGENCLLWTNNDELINKIKYYLSNYDILKELQYKCINFAMQNFRTKHRAKYILNKASEHGLINN